MYKLGLSRSVKMDEDFSVAIDELEKLGYDGFDLDLCKWWSKRENEVENYQNNLQNALDRIAKSKLIFNGVHISFGPNWDYSSPDEEKRSLAVERTKEMFAKIDPYAPYCYILHGSFEPIKAEERTLHIEALKKSLKELRPFTDAKICVEILPRTCLFNTSKEALEIVESLDGIDVCVDVNHFLQEKSEEGLLRLGSYVKTLHISDHDYVDERHWLPGNGSIDWMKLIGSLEKIGYTGMFHYESAGTHEEVKQNYLGLFARYNEK